MKTRKWIALFLALLLCVGILPAAMAADVDRDTYAGQVTCILNPEQGWPGNGTGGTVDDVVARASCSRKT